MNLMLHLAHRQKNRGTISLFYKHVKLTVLASILCICALLVLSTNVFAYHLEGPKWPNQPAPGVCCAHFIMQFSGAWFGSDRQGFVDGYNAWNISAAPVYFREVGRAPFFVDDYSNFRDNRDGYTVYYNSGATLTKANSFLNYYFTQNYSPATIQGVAAHEIGHAIGIAHTGGCVLMTPNTSTRDSCNVFSPQSDDTRAANALY